MFLPAQHNSMKDQTLIARATIPFPRLPAKLPRLSCNRCGHIWIPRIPRPGKCPACNMALREDVQASRLLQVRRRQKIPFRVRQAVLAKTGGRCYYCSHPISGRRATMDHVVMLVDGGDDSLANLLPACRKCNSARDRMTPEEMRQYVSDRGWLPGQRPISRYAYNKLKPRIYYEGTPNYRKLVNA